MDESAQEIAGPTTSAPAAGEHRSRSGLLYGLAAYGAWGVIPLYFRALSHVPPLLVLCHRIVWSVLFLVAVVAVRRDWPAIGGLLRQRRNLALLSCGALLIAGNWLVFIYAVSSGQLLQASLGYFINPLLSIALGLVFLKERLRRWQWLAVLLAGAGVANLAVRGAGFPWIPLSLAGSFGFYGLVRKKVNVDSLHGLLVETTILLPAGVVVLALFGARHTPAPTLGLLSLSGVFTAVPLLFFGAALRRLRLATMGFLQYLGPTMQFLVALLIFGEPLDRTKLGSFGLCWAAIAVYAADSALRRVPQEVSDEPE